MPETMTITNHIISKHFTMKQAAIENTSGILALLQETAKWLQSKGSSQWNALLQGIDTHNTKEAIQRGDVFICKKDEEIVGMVMLLQQPSEWDCKLWGRRAHPKDGAVYLHRLAVSRKYAHHKLGESILKWCSESIMFAGKDKIRLDCIADNKHLNAFYSQNGYTYIGEKDGYSLYEK